MDNALLAHDSMLETSTLSNVLSAVLSTRLRAEDTDQGPTASILYRSIVRLAWSTVLVGRNYEIRWLHNSRRDLKSDLGPITRSKRSAGVQSCLLSPLARAARGIVDEISDGRDCGEPVALCGAEWYCPGAAVDVHRIVLRRRYA